MIQKKMDLHQLFKKFQIIKPLQSRVLLVMTLLIQLAINPSHPLALMLRKHKCTGYPHTSSLRILKYVKILCHFLDILGLATENADPLYLRALFVTL